MSQPAHQSAAEADKVPAALSDEEVAARVLGGDASLFEILMRRHNQRLFRAARAILSDDAEAEDVLQETYLRAYRELASFRGEARFATWLTRIACHEALARAQRRNRLVMLSGSGGGTGDAGQEGGGPSDPPAATAGPDRELENRELKAALQQAVEILPDPLRAVFCLREIEGLSTEETADALGLTIENVRVRLHRAKRALRQTLDQRIGQEVRRLYLFDGARCDRLVETVFARLSLRGSHAPVDGPAAG